MSSLNSKEELPHIHTEENLEETQASIILKSQEDKTKEARLKLRDKLNKLRKESLKNIHYCSKCDFKTQYSNNLNKHIKNVHLLIKRGNKNTASIVREYKSQEIYECSLCLDFRSNFRGNVRRHMRNKHKVSTRERTARRKFVQIFDKVESQLETESTTPETVFIKDEMENDVATIVIVEDDINDKDTNSNELTNQIFKCEECDFQTLYIKSLERHQQSGHQHDSFQCSVCRYRTKYFHKLKSHIENHDHNPSELFKCEKCNYKSMIEKNFKIHVKLTHKESDIGEGQLTNTFYNCQLCSFETKYKYIFKRHLLRKHANVDQLRTHKCLFCGYRFTRKYYLTRHVNTIHKKEILNQNKIIKDELITESDDDNDEETESIGIKANLDETSGSMYFKCEECNFKTAHKRSLKRHEQSGSHFFTEEGYVQSMNQSIKSILLSNRKQAHKRDN